MSATFLHIGIPITNKKPNMSYNKLLKVWLTNPDDYEYKIEYLKFEEGTPFPEIMHKNPHIAYQVDCIENYSAKADSVIFEPMTIGENVRIAFVVIDDTIIELYEEK